MSAMCAISLHLHRWEEEGELLEGVAWADMEAYAKLAQGVVLGSPAA